MSSYTYIIFTCSHLDEIGEPGINTLLPILKGQNLPPLNRCKEGEGVVYTMCGNYLPFTDLVEAIQSVPWEIPEKVQLFHKHESADKYEETSLKLKRLVREFYMEWTPDEDGTFDEFSQSYGKWATHVEVVEEPA